MLTRNYYKALAARISVNGSLFKVKSWLNVDLNLGSNLGVFFGEDSSSSAVPNMRLLQTKTTTYGGVILGTGDTPPTLDDYRLSGTVISTFAYNSSFTSETDGDGVTMQTVFTITNTGTEAFTIKEIGLIASTGTNASEQYKMLYDRTVLDNPVTIPAGGVGQVTYTIRMDFPTT